MAKNGSNKGHARTKTSKQRKLDEAQQLTRPENPKPSKKQKRVPSLPPSPSPSASPSPEESPIIDVSHKQFTLNMKCTLGGVTVHSDADVLKLREFEFHKYFTKTIKDITDEEFVLWNIEPGLKNQIRLGVTKFDKHYKKKGR